MRSDADGFMLLSRTKCYLGEVSDWGDIALEPRTDWLVEARSLNIRRGALPGEGSPERLLPISPTRFGRVTSWGSVARSAIQLALEVIHHSAVFRLRAEEDDLGVHTDSDRVPRRPVEQLSTNNGLLGRV